MPASITMTDKQHVAAGVSILDQDGQPFLTLPPGITVTFSTSDSTIAGVTVQPDGMNIDVTSGNVGIATVTALVAGMPTGDISDTLAVAVTNSAPGSVNFTVGSPVDE